MLAERGSIKNYTRARPLCRLIQMEREREREIIKSGRERDYKEREIIKRERDYKERDYKERYTIMIRNTANIVRPTT